MSPEPTGAPAVADPGSGLVRLAHQKGLGVAPLTGPSSFLLALMASGLNGQCFACWGYLPIQSKARIQLFCLYLLSYTSPKLAVMNPIYLYLLGVGLTALICLTVVLILRNPLKKILWELSKNQKAAAFWVTYTGIILVLVPLIFAMAIVPDIGKDTEDLFFQVSHQLMWALAGLVVSLFVVGIVLIKFVPGNTNSGKKR